MTTQDNSVLKGVVSLMLTPFKADGEIDWKAYDAYVEWQLSAQPDGLFSVCGSSEMKWLTREERLMLARQTVNRAEGTPVLATANLENHLSDHEEEVRRIGDAGVSGIVLVPPPDMGEEQARLGDYFAQLAEISPCPVYLYEWPQIHPYSISPEIWGLLSKQYGMKGIKDTTCTMEGIQAKIMNSPKETIVFQANTPFLLDSITAGAQGIMAITSAALNELVVAFWKEAKKDPFSPKAKTFQQQLVFLDSVLRFAYPATAKYLAQLQGLPLELYCRWPIELKPEARKAISVFYEVYKEWKVSHLHKEEALR